MRYASPPESYGALWQAQWKITCATVAKIVLCFLFSPFSFYSSVSQRPLCSSWAFCCTRPDKYAPIYHTLYSILLATPLSSRACIYHAFARSFWDFLRFVLSSVCLNQQRLFFLLPHTFCQIHLPHTCESELWTNTICFAPNSSLVIFISKTIEFIRTNIKQISHLASTRIGLNGRQSHKQEQFEGEGDGICEYCVGQENEKDQFEWGAKLVQIAQCASEAARRVWLARKVNYINLEVLNWFQQWKIVIDSGHVMQRMNL